MQTLSGDRLVQRLHAPFDGLPLVWRLFFPEFLAQGHRFRLSVPSFFESTSLLTPHSFSGPRM